ncbi:MAG: MBL fold metallo-hydrolase [Ignavibacteria bacterium]|jgi:L-ascorbate metabolism protein UlaG (beta-lactamase superfamily)
MNNVKKYLLFVLCILMLTITSCNIFYIAVRNVPVFFSHSRAVANKIKDPIKADVRLSALWIGHSTVLLQMDDKVIITDPFLSNTVGELARRVVDPGIDPDDIPRCDIILISHPHFDHLCLSSLGMLEDRSSGAALIFPEGTEKFLPSMNFEFIRMRNDDGYLHTYIGERRTINNVVVTTVFARHWGGRYGLDGYVWGDNSYTSYIIQYNGLTVYYAGDTGYDTVMFKKIGDNFNIDLAMIPIGPCADCTNTGTRTHAFPPDAVMIFKDIKAKWMIPIHYGTLYFAQAQADMPLETLRSIIKTDNLSDMIFPLNIGEQKVFIKK